MARIRYLKPDFFSDEDLCSLPYEARISFAGLWCYADKAGRLEDRPRFLKAMIFPYDKVDFEKQLIALASNKSNGKPFISRYQSDGRRLIQILGWEKHQKPHHTEKESYFPPAPPLTTMEKGMEMENQIKRSTELDNRLITVKKMNVMEDFEIFWKSYPKKKNKGDAERAWIKINPTKEIKQKIAETVEKLKKSAGWIKSEGQYIPYPASWLNNKGWEDEEEKPFNRWTSEPKPKCPKCGKENAKSLIWNHGCSICLRGDNELPEKVSRVL